LYRKLSEKKNEVTSAQMTTLKRSKQRKQNRRRIAPSSISYV